MNDIYHIDKARMRASFDRAAAGYDAAAVLQKEVRTRMLARLDLVKLAPSVILDAGCCTGHASHALAERFSDARVVSLGRIRPDNSSFRVKHEPGNPAADASGNVKYPNVNTVIEMTDMRDAQRSYEANLNIISATRRMIQRTLDILKA